jgi:hypothetical protein
MTPEPSVDWSPAPASSCTTLGPTFAATCSTEPGPGFTTGWPAAAVTGVLGERSAWSMVNATAAPTPAETTATANPEATKNPVRERVRWRVSAGGAGGAD